MNDKLVSFSFSAISGFENCPRAFKYRYIDEIPSAFTSIEAWMGTSVHAALEWAYTVSKSGDKPDNSTILDKYHEHWSGERREIIKVIKRGFTEEHYLNIGEELLDKYNNRVFANDSSFTMALESRFKIEIAEGIFYKGVIDRVSRSQDGVLRATDFKTGKVGKPADTLQLPSYAMFLFTKSIDEEIEIIYEDLKQNKTISTQFSRKEVKDVKTQLLEKIHRIRECRDFYPMPSILCSWCGYNGICDATPDMHPVEGESTGVSGSKCPTCNKGNLLVKTGKFGPFLGCSNYPACRYTAECCKETSTKVPEVKTDSNACPSCGGNLIVRSGKFGEFIGCANFPKCRFTREVNR